MTGMMLFGFYILFGNLRIRFGLRNCLALNYFAGLREQNVFRIFDLVDLYFQFPHRAFFGVCWVATFAICTIDWICAGEFNVVRATLSALLAYRRFQTFAFIVTKLMAIITSQRIRNGTDHF